MLYFALTKEYFTISSLGDVVILGRTNLFRFNHPAEAQELREKRKVRPFLDFSLLKCTGSRIVRCFAIEDISKKNGIQSVYVNLQFLN